MYRTLACTNFPLHRVGRGEGDKITDGSSPVRVVRDRRSGGVSEGVKAGCRVCVWGPDARCGGAVGVEGDDEVDEVVGQ